MAISRFGTSSVAQGLPKYQKFWDQSTALGDFESIATTAVTSNSATITFASVPTGYVNLQLRMFARANSGGNQAYMFYFNNDTTNSNYSYHCMGGDGTSFVQSLITNPHIGSIRDNAWNTTIVDIPDYLNTSKTKVRRSISGSMSQTDGSVFYYGGAWNNTAAINRLDITHSGAASFIPGSVFALYGMKG